ncbi:putative F-box/LRR-repeat protein 23 [Impatiens glandulifera]|uniref:putative F-box/LRR-repeat protein 23 n=1 Tax=Impatiens glandulifera TaxID=253017 RepID=UPI001FB04B1B|nr:putative F-box/LRR-repeat protein 23 [Impatiens glandulifera]
MLSTSRYLRSAADSSSITPCPGKKVIEAQNWVDFLPRDVSLKIMKKVGIIEILNTIPVVCHSWHKISKDPELWRYIDMENLDIENLVRLRPTDCDLVEMTKSAIDRSCGQLIDLKIASFGCDDLLMHLSNRKNQLRSLRLVACWDISDEGLSEAVKKLSSLEELHIYYGNITDEGLELVGRHCPGLRSLTFNQQGMFSRDESKSGNDEAFAIARSMPELCHLSLFGNQMSNNGLQAILDSCPHLESLDLRQCFKVDLGDFELSKRCSSIKGLRSLHDSTDDYEYDSSIFNFDFYI